MSAVISWVGIKDGQGLTTSALAVAFELAYRHHVLLIDADQSGTGTMVDLLDVEPAQRGMSRFTGRIQSISVEMLREEAVQVPKQRNLFGHPRPQRRLREARLRSGPGARAGPVPRALPLRRHRLGRGLVPRPGSDSPARAADAICRLSDRVLVQFLDSPVLLTRAIRVLQQARPSKAELVLVEARRQEQLRRELRAALHHHLPESSSWW